MSEEKLIPDLPAVKDRVKGKFYMYGGEQRIWLGDRFGCIHGKNKTRCIICLGIELPAVKHRIKGQIYMYKDEKRTWLGYGWGCMHGKYKSRCIDCHGREICEHNKLRARCVQCSGSQICTHGKRREQCVFCKGSGLCIHNHSKASCSKCLSNQYCVHRKFKGRCYLCHINTHPQNFCQLCKYIYIKESPYKPHCFRCFCYLNPDKKIPRKYMMKENFINEYLQKEFPNITIVHNKKIEDGCSILRPDWSIHCGEYGIVIECDEDKHKAYTCESRRIMTIFQDFGNIPLVVLRFNPDEYEGKECFEFDEKNCLSPTEEWNKRKIVLKNRIEYYLKNKPIKELTLEYIFYSEEDEEIIEDEDITDDQEIAENEEIVENEEIKNDKIPEQILNNKEGEEEEEEEEEDNILIINNLSNQISELKL